MMPRIRLSCDTAKAVEWTLAFLCANEDQAPLDVRVGQTPKALHLAGGQVTYVDATDHDWLSQWKWRVLHGPGSKPYVVRRVRRDGGRRLILLHRLILSAPAGSLVDHRDGDTFNNCRSNLRLATPAQNAQNCIRPAGVSGFRGVTRKKKHWQAAIYEGSRRLNLGTFETPEEAARVYDKHAKLKRGEFAILNFEEAS